MKKIDNEIIELFDSIVKLEVYKEYYDEDNQFIRGNSVGSGSYIQLTIPKERLSPEAAHNNIIPCILTNRHVLENAKNIKLRTKVKSETHKFDTDYPELRLADIDERFIVFHDELDLAILMMGYYIHQSEANGIRVSHKYVHEDLFLKEEPKLNIFSQVAIMGYPLGLSNSGNHHPIVYQGSFAYPPSADFESKSEYLLNCDSVNGNSGSIIYSIDEKGIFLPIGVQYGILKHPDHNLTLSKAVKIKEVLNIKNKILEKYYPIIQ